MNIEKFPKVEIGSATCLSPIKLFFEELFHLELNNIHFLYQLIPALYEAGLILGATSFNLDEQEYELPFYTFNEINKGIEVAIQEINQLKLKQ